MWYTLASRVLESGEKENSGIFLLALKNFDNNLHQEYLCLLILQAASKRQLDQVKILITQIPKLQTSPYESVLLQALKNALVSNYSDIATVLLLNYKYRKPSLDKLLLELDVNSPSVVTLAPYASKLAVDTVLLHTDKTHAEKLRPYASPEGVSSAVVTGALNPTKTPSPKVLTPPTIDEIPTPKESPAPLSNATTPSKTENGATTTAQADPQDQQ